MRSSRLRLVALFAIFAGIAQREEISLVVRRYLLPG
jgi:hypothetical protein